MKIDFCIHIYNKDGEWIICGEESCSTIHMTSDGHDFNDNIKVHPSHKMVIHPIDGIYCKVCKAYSYAPPQQLSDICPGLKDWNEG